MKKNVPPKRRSTATPGADASRRPSNGRGVSPPKLFVQIQRDRWPHESFIPAQIKIRRGCYRYLVWREDGKKRELYLGKVKILAPSARTISPARADLVRTSAGARRGGKK